MPKCSVSAFDEAVEQALRQEGEPREQWCLFYPERIGGSEAWEGEGAVEERAHAVIEGISFLLRQLIESDLKRDCLPREVKVIGGGSSSSIWLRVLADVLGVPVRRGGGDSLLGVALLCTDVAGVSELAVDRVLGPLVEPLPYRRRAYEKRYRRWVSDLREDEG